MLDFILTDHIQYDQHGLRPGAEKQYPTMSLLLNSGHQAKRRILCRASDLLPTRVSPPWRSACTRTLLHSTVLRQSVLLDISNHRDTLW